MLDFLEIEKVISLFIACCVFQVIQEEGETKYKYKPTYNLKDRKAFLNLLKRCDLHGDGGLLLDDIEESLPKCQQTLKKLGIVYEIIIL